MRDTKASVSAMTVALARAHLHWLGVIDDPFASTVLTRRHQSAALMFKRGPLADYGRSPTFGYIACRTRFFDDAVIAAVKVGLTQFVTLGAGYDSRPLRLARPGVRYFEVDHPATQAEKRRRLPGGDVSYVGAEFRRDDLPDALLRSGFERDRPAIFLAEGLTMYLDQATNEGLFSTVASVAAAGSRLAVDFAHGGGSVSLPSQVIASAIRLSWQFSGEQRYDWADETAALDLLRSAGWSATEVSNGPVLAKRYLQGTPLRVDGISPSAFCVLATRT
jgi:methyltransferase (TIGR00027 family)